MKKTKVGGGGRGDGGGVSSPAVGGAGPAHRLSLVIVLEGPVCLIISQGAWARRAVTPQMALVWSAPAGRTPSLTLEPPTPRAPPPPPPLLPPPPLTTSLIPRSSGKRLPVVAAAVSLLSDLLLRGSTAARRLSETIYTS